MKLRFWEKTPQGPGIELPLDVNFHGGSISGTVYINPDGTFEGRIYSDAFKSDIEQLVAMGFVDKLELKPIIKPAVPPWVQTQRPR